MPVPCHYEIQKNCSLWKCQESVQENETYIILLDFEIFPSRWSDLVIITELTNKQKEKEEENLSDWKGNKTKRETSTKTLPENQKTVEQEGDGDTNCN